MDATPTTFPSADAPIALGTAPNETANAQDNAPEPHEGLTAEANAEAQPQADASAPDAPQDDAEDEAEDDTPSLNKRLTSKHYRGRDVHILETTAIVRFDKRGRCKGIVRYSGQHFLDEPKEIGLNILAACKRHPDLFNVKPDPDALAAGEVDGNGPNISDPDEGTDKGNNPNLQAEVERPAVDPAQSTNPNALADRARLIKRRDAEAEAAKEVPKDEKPENLTGNIMPGMVAAADKASDASETPTAEPVARATAPTSTRKRGG